MSQVRTEVVLQEDDITTIVTQVDFVETCPLFATCVVYLLARMFFVFVFPFVCVLFYGYSLSSVFSLLRRHGNCF